MERDGTPAPGSWKASDKRPRKSRERKADGIREAGEPWLEPGAMANEGSLSVKEAALWGHNAARLGRAWRALARWPAPGSCLQGHKGWDFQPQHLPALTSPPMPGRSEAPPAPLRPPAPLGSASLPHFSLLPPLLQQQTPGAKYSSPATCRLHQRDTGPSHDVSQSYSE